MPLRFGLSTLFLIRGPFSRVERFIEQTGVKVWEIVDEGGTKLDQDSVKALKQLQASLSLEYAVHAPFADMNLASPNEEVRKLVLKQLRASLERAYQLGCRLWVLHPGMPTGLSPAYPGLDFDLNLRSIRELAGVADDLGLTVAVENMPEPFTYLLKDVRECERFFNEIGAENVGLAFDVGHANTLGQIDLFLSRLPNKIVHVHAHDNDGSFDNHLPIGEGEIQWRELLPRLVNIGFSGMIVAETFAEPLLSLRRLKSFVS